jgi:hypothetical protein
VLGEDGLVKADRWCIKMGCQRHVKVSQNDWHTTPQIKQQGEQPSSPDKVSLSNNKVSLGELSASERGRIVWRDDTRWCKLPERRCLAFIQKHGGCEANVSLQRAKGMWKDCPPKWARVDTQTRELSIVCNTGRASYALIDPYDNTGRKHFESPLAESKLWQVYDPVTKPKVLTSDQVVVRCPNKDYNQASTACYGTDKLTKWRFKGKSCHEAYSTIFREDGLFAAKEYCERLGCKLNKEHHEDVVMSVARDAALHAQVRTTPTWPRSWANSSLL